MIPLSCSVRGCGAPLAQRPGGLGCARGHAFDRARSGYVNLLQPQDRRSLAAGDSQAAVRARRRLYEAGVFEPLLAGVEEIVRGIGLARGARVMDVGCGEGSLLGRLAARLELDAVGLDLSTHAIDAAARAFPGPTWVVANGDRRLPVMDGGLELVLSITGRRHAGEFARVLAPGGRVLVAVPAADDLLELRAAVLGEARELETARPVAEELAPLFRPLSERELRTRAMLDALGLADLLASTYRAGRPGREERAAALGPLELTLAWRVILLERVG